VRLIALDDDAVVTPVVAPGLLENVKTYPIAMEGKETIFAFEIGNTFTYLRWIAYVLRTVEGVSDVRVRRLFGRPSDVHVKFRYLDQECIVHEPWGDSSRYWIGPEDSEEEQIDLRPIEEAFQRYRLPIIYVLFVLIVFLFLLSRLFI